ncbi:helix-turn-helix domain-containing protein [Streptomyces akebiae]|uniref:helix-turn-helix domain-containing protein n=1 Tax=Streptomyces akebiae TaxID=2865673 RepID=UPI0021759359|nr:helix-turn-helix domain-containing protein [Streptomyces akebiae]
MGEGGFHLVRAAEALHVHRNTVAYRMQKIEQLTGRPPRDHRTTMAVYLACLSDELGGGGESPTRPKESAIDDVPPRPRRTGWGEALSWLPRIGAERVAAGRGRVRTAPIARGAR